MQGKRNRNQSAALNRQLHHVHLLHIMDQQLSLELTKTFVEDANGRQANLTAQPSTLEMLCFAMDKFLHLSYLWHGTGLEQTYVGPYSNKKHHLPEPGAA